MERSGWIQDIVLEVEVTEKFIAEWMVMKFSVQRIFQNGFNSTVCYFSFSITMSSQ